MMSAVATPTAASAAARFRATSTARAARLASDASRPRAVVARADARRANVAPHASSRDDAPGAPASRVRAPPSQRARSIRRPAVAVRPSSLAFPRVPPPPRPDPGASASARARVASRGCAHLLSILRHGPAHRPRAVPARTRELASPKFETPTRTPPGSPNVVSTSTFPSSVLNPDSPRRPPPAAVHPRSPTSA
jgi:hypothetical protein